MFVGFRNEQLPFSDPYFSTENRTANAFHLLNRIYDLSIVKDGLYLYGKSLTKMDHFLWVQTLVQCSFSFRDKNRNSLFSFFGWPNVPEVK